MLSIVYKLNHDNILSTMEVRNLLFLHNKKSLTIASRLMHARKLHNFSIIGQSYTDAVSNKIGFKLICE